MDPFNDGIENAAKNNDLEFTRSDVSFIKKERARTENSDDFAHVTIGFELRRSWPAHVDLASLNELMNRFLISIIGDAIREGASDVIDTWALAKVKSVLSIDKGKYTLYSIDPTQATNIDFTVFTKGNFLFSSN